MNTYPLSLWSSSLLSSSLERVYPEGEIRLDW